MLKSKSLIKEDFEAKIFDNSLGKDFILKYSIKSSLGSPASLLNSSAHTDFLYQIENFDPKFIHDVNLINTRTKLKDRINFIISRGGKIKFVKASSDTLEYNLKMIDSKMDQYIANALLQSYISNNKNLLDLFLKSNKILDENFAIKKLGDFLEGISFGFFPSVKWDGIKKVNGGLVIIKNNGNIIVLDLIYYRDEVIKYLIKETKIDSPNATRHNMLKLYYSKNDNKIYFTLNLQIRYKNSYTYKLMK